MSGHMHQQDVGWSKDWATVIAMARGLVWRLGAEQLGDVVFN